MNALIEYGYLNNLGNPGDESLVRNFFFPAEGQQCFMYSSMLSQENVKIFSSLGFSWDVIK